MAWSSVGTLGTFGSATANQSTLAFVTSAVLAVGDVGVIVLSMDNNQTTDGDEGAVSSASDSAGNTWLKAKEFCNGQGAAQGGATVSVWYCQVGIQLASGGTVTFNLTNNTSRDATCATGWKFQVAAGSRISINNTATVADDAVDPTSLDVTTPNFEYLRIRATASELNSNTAWTGTTNFTQFTTVRSSNSASAMSARAEFRILTGTTSASDPTLSAADHASAYIAFQENPTKFVTDSLRTLLSEAVVVPTVRPPVAESDRAGVTEAVFPRVRTTPTESDSAGLLDVAAAVARVAIAESDRVSLSETARLAALVPTNESDRAGLTENVFPRVRTTPTESDKAGLTEAAALRSRVVPTESDRVSMSETGRQVTLIFPVGA